MSYLAYHADFRYEIAVTDPEGVQWVFPLVLVEIGKEKMYQITVVVQHCGRRNLFSMFFYWLSDLKSLVAGSIRCRFFQNL